VGGAPPTAWCGTRAVRRIVQCVAEGRADVSRRFRLVTGAGVLALTALGGCTAVGTAPEAELAAGREQLVQAFDAAWVRVLASGEYYDILGRFPKERPGAARSYIVTMADCLPQPDNVPFPEKPVGLLRKILETGEIRRGSQMSPLGPGDTATYVSPASDALLEAMLRRIEEHYGVKLRVIDVMLKPPSNATTSLLVDGRADFIDQLNATGGDTQGMRRRTSRRFTCTLSAVTQYIQVPEGSALAGRLQNFDDVRRDTGIRICTGPLSTQTIRAFLPRHPVTTKYVGDISNCVKEIEAGRADAIANPLPDLAIAGVTGYRAIPTLIVSGTPLWVAREGIVCPPDEDPKRDDPCFAQ
jgi:hypothetical protein